MSRIDFDSASPIVDGLDESARLIGGVASGDQIFGR
jgi:hypothetical protein